MEKVGGYLSLNTNEEIIIFWMMRVIGKSRIFPKGEIHSSSIFPLFPRVIAPSPQNLGRMWKKKSISKSELISLAFSYNMEQGWFIPSSAVTLSASTNHSPVITGLVHVNNFQKVQNGPGTSQA